MTRVADVGKKLVVSSTFLFALSIPTSLALDNLAAGIGLLGILFLLIGREIFPFPPLKPLIFLLTPEIFEAIIFYPKKLFKTDLNLHIVPYYSVFRTLGQDPKFIKMILYVLIFSTALLDLSIIFEAFTWQNVKHLDLSNLSFHLHPIRAKGFLNHPLTTAGVVFLLLVLFIAAYFQFRNNIFLFPVFLSVIALIFTESRSYWVGFFIFIIFLLIFFRNRKTLILVFSFFLIGIALAQVPQIKSRFESILNTKTNYSNIDRLALWKTNFSAYVRDYSLRQKLLGAGYGANKLAWKEFKESFNSVSPVKNLTDVQLRRHFHGGLTHNIYLKYLTKYGISGFLGFLFFWISILYYNFTYKGPLKVFIKTLTAGYLGFLAAGFFENNFCDAEVQFAVMFILGLNFALQQKDIEKKLLHQRESDLQKNQV